VFSALQRYLIFLDLPFVTGSMDANIELRNVLIAIGY
jgi:hypothetical protein